MAAVMGPTVIQVATLDDLNGALAFVDQATSGSFTIQLTASIQEGTSVLLANGGTQLTYPDGLTDASGSTNATSLVNGASLPVPPRQDLYALNLNSGVSVTIDGTNPGGANFTIDGRNSTVTAGGAVTQGTTPTYRGLFVYAGQVTLSDLTVENALAQGGTGDGGGAGLGGGLFVAGTGNSNAGGKATTGAVALSGVTFLNDAAIGGAGGGDNGNLGGGGGLGGAGGLGAGGGGGVAADGGVGVGSNYPASNGGSGIILGASGGGNGSNSSASNGSGGSFGGGGGGGGSGFSRGGGGGVGGGGAADGSNGSGPGGFGGGGGGGSSGGFGGGGGGANGGFGGGGEDGGFGGGDFSGGGLGAGGAVFVQSGGTLTVTGSLSENGGAVTGGTGSEFGGTAGQMFASGFYFQGGNAAGALNFNTQDVTTGAATLQTVSDVIGDDTGSAAAAGYTGPDNYTPGSVGVVKTGIGTLDLTAANTYTGGTVLNGGILELGTDNSAGSGNITFGAGDETLRLDFTGTTATPDALAAPLMGFVAGDTIDLSTLDSAGATAIYNGTTLTVANGTTEDDLTINAAPAGYEYAVHGDGGTGTDVVLQAIPAPAITAPANGTDTNNNKPVISGAGESGDTVTLTINGAAVTPPQPIVVGVNGQWSYTPANALADGNYSVTAVETSPSGTDTSGISNTETFTVDTTAPAVSSPTLTVGQNTGATPIGIAAPTDNLTAANGLAIVAGSLPSDGTVTLSDGTTRVSAGEVLTVAQLTGLAFTPTPGAANQGSTFTYGVTDGAGNASTGTAALNIGAAGAPTLAGTHATPDTAEGTVAPFTGVTLSDPSAGTETLTITLRNGGGTLSGTGLVANTDGTYTLAGSAASVTQQLDALSFTPAASPPGTSATTTFVLSDTTAAGTSVTDAGTSVTDTAAAAPPPPPPPPPPNPTPDTVTIDGDPAYIGNGTFTLTGTASSPSGVKSVEISAISNDGARQDLGAATFNANGTFTFTDHVGPNKQSFIEATLTDGAGVQTVSSDPGFNLRGGLGPHGDDGEQNSFSPTAQVSSTLFRPDGLRTVSVEAAGQTVTSNAFDIFENHGQADTTFVFNPGFGIDVVGGFRLGGPGHDVLDLPSSDFTSLAQVFHNTGDIQGSAFITDPKTGDAIRLAGVTTAELKAHPKDIAFHA